MGAVERQTQNNINQIEKRHVARYEIAKKYCENKEVLDVACGCGYGSNILSEVAKSVRGGDYSTEAIEYANKHWLKDNISFTQLNIKDKPILGQYDVFVSLETLEHIDHKLEDTIQFYKSNLKSGGLLIVSHPENEENLNLNPFHVHFNITKELMTELLSKNGFTIEETIVQTGYDGFYNYVIHIAKLV
jgi:2-polyprenyl-3-methyl-5-hydroxy-6-metoxy-1,4-benzoquinol methylase